MDFMSLNYVSQLAVISCIDVTFDNVR